MIGKIKKFNFQSLFILVSLALIITSFVFQNANYILTFLLFFIISSFTTTQGLTLIKNLNLFQRIRKEAPTSHLSKSYTPTAGGVFIIMPFLFLLFFLSIKYYSIKILILLVCSFGFFIIGFSDDYLSIKNKKNTGLKVKEKFILQSLITIIFIFLAIQRDYIDPIIPITNSLEINTSYMIIPISFLTIVGLSNSVNLTDGLDGLASGCSSIVFCGLGIEILMKGQNELIIFSILCFSMSGLCLGFLQCNKYPAKIFMGDTGSLALGGSLGAVGVVTKHEIVLAITGGLFVLEAVSVIVQVISFKLTGKRIFMMAPIHHHFEKKGWPESTVVIRFWIISLILAMIGLATLKLR